MKKVIKVINCGSLEYSEMIAGILKYNILWDMGIKN